jgi:signal transduction histidine kinase
MTDDLAAQLARLRELETEFEAAVERAKVAAIYNLAYGLSHEFNNPLANISSRAQALLIDEKDPERRRKLAAINAQAFRAHEMIADLMLFAKPPALDKQPLDLPALLAQAAQELQSMAAEQGTDLHLEPAPALPSLSADRAALLEAIKAVIKNSLEALGEGGSVCISTEAADDFLTITIADDGPGIPPEVRPYLFDPYFSGREAGRGLGLGLCKCWRIVDLHGGRIEVESEPGEGTALRLIFPL